MQATWNGMQVFVIGKDISADGVDIFLVCKGTERTPYVFGVPVADVEAD